MTLTRKDAVATGLTGLAVFVSLATHEAWNVPLVGDSHRRTRRDGRTNAECIDPLAPPIATRTHHGFERGHWLRR